MNRPKPFRCSKDCKAHKQDSAHSRGDATLSGVAPSRNVDPRLDTFHTQVTVPSEGALVSEPHSEGRASRTTTTTRYALLTPEDTPPQGSEGNSTHHDDRLSRYDMDMPRGRGEYVIRPSGSKTSLATTTDSLSLTTAISMQRKKEAAARNLEAVQPTRRKNDSKPRRRDSRLVQRKSGEASTVKKLFYAQCLMDLKRGNPAPLVATTNDATNNVPAPRAAAFTTLTPFDVLLGRGERSNRHNGNILFLEAKERFQSRFLRTRSRKEKASIAQEFVDHMASEHGSRFLALDNATQQWYIVDKKRALEKAKQVLRVVLTAEELSTQREWHAALGLGRQEG